MDSTEERATCPAAAPARPSVAVLAARLLAAGAGYYLSARLGLLVPYLGTHISLVWLPTGVSVAVFRRWGPAMAPAVFLAAVAANLSIGGPLWIAALLGLGNTGGTGLAAWLLRRWHFDDHLLRRRDVVAFFGAVALGMAVTSLNGVAWLGVAHAPEAAQPLQAWLSWFVGDVVGALLAGVPLIAWSRHGAAQAFGGRAGAGNLLLHAGVLACSLAVFSTSLGQGSAWVFPLLALPLFLLAMLALRGGILASSIGVLLLSVVAAWGTARGTGPFAAQDPRAGSLALWSYIAAQAGSCLMISGLGMALRASQRQMKAVTDNLPGLIARMDTDYRYTFANVNYVRWFSLAESPVGRTVAEVFGTEVFEGVRARIDQALHGEDVVFDLTNIAGGAAAFMQVHYVPDRDVDGRVIGVYGLVTDRTEQQRSRERIEASERQLRAVTDNLPVLITYVDADETLRFMNGTFHDWLGVDLDKAVDRPLAEVVGAEHYASRRAHLHAALAGERVEFEVVSVTRAGPRNLQTVYVPDVRADGSVRGVFTLATDVTALKDVERELQRLARIDTLTGLANRRQFDELLEQALARSRRARAPLALIFLDIDRFKAINDTHGHGVGDAVLMEFAARLLANLRANDLAARLAGDEFVVILDGLASVDEASGVCAKLLNAIREPVRVGERALVVTVSMGLAWLDGQSEVSAKELMARADRALYRAKDEGRDALRIA